VAFPENDELVQAFGDAGAGTLETSVRPSISSWPVWKKEMAGRVRRASTVPHTVVSCAVGSLTRQHRAALRARGWDDGYSHAQPGALVHARSSSWALQGPASPPHPGSVNVHPLA